MPARYPIVVCSAHARARARARAVRSFLTTLRREVARDRATQALLAPRAQDTVRYAARTPPQRRPCCSYCQDRCCTQRCTGWYTPGGVYHPIPPGYTTCARPSRRVTYWASGPEREGTLALPPSLPLPERSRALGPMALASIIGLLVKRAPRLQRSTTPRTVGGGPVGRPRSDVSAPVAAGLRSGVL